MRRQIKRARIVSRDPAELDIELTEIVEQPARSNKFTALSIENCQIDSDSQNNLVNNALACIDLDMKNVDSMTCIKISNCKIYKRIEETQRPVRRLKNSELKRDNESIQTTATAAICDNPKVKAIESKITKRRFSEIENPENVVQEDSDEDVKEEIKDALEDPIENLQIELVQPQQSIGMRVILKAKRLIRNFLPIGQLI